MEEQVTVNMPALGDKAPSFKAVTTTGEINFPDDYRGKWVVLFSHPADFTPVCTSEIATFAAMRDDFHSLNAELIGLSIDSNNSHLAWIKEIQDNIRFGKYDGQPVDFPIIADIKAEVARKYGMVHPSMSGTKAVRAVFIIDDEGYIRTILYYPQTTGRNFDEIKRVIEALQVTDRYGVSTPADWQPGKDILLGCPSELKGMNERINEQKGNNECQEWFFCVDKGDKYAAGKQAAK